MSFGRIFLGKSVFVTGHTGFKGAWLAEWLLQLGARVTGYGLPPPTNPALFDQLRLASRIARHVVADIRDSVRLAETLGASRPDFVFHLAAQPLVRESYRSPVETYSTNVIGTLHLLEALRRVDHPCAAVLVTTDKVYDNHAGQRAYTEHDRLGGHDPYSSSKAAMEIATCSWRRSFFEAHPVKIATARAGNVVGGGDWAADRIVPDCIRALQRGAPISVRHPAAVRPWQHVLEPLAGYLWLAARLAATKTDPRLLSAFNFGPADDSSRTVRDVVEALLREWPGVWVDASTPGSVHEASLLRLDIAKAREVLGWYPTWGFAETIRETARWYRAASASPGAAPVLTREQIDSYSALAGARCLPWTLD